MFNSGSNFKEIVDELVAKSRQLEDEVRFALMLALVTVLREDYATWIRLLQFLCTSKVAAETDIQNVLAFLTRIQLPTASQDDACPDAYNLLAGTEESWIFTESLRNLHKIKERARHILANRPIFAHLKQPVLHAVGSSAARDKPAYLQQIEDQVRVDFNSRKKAQPVPSNSLFAIVKMEIPAPVVSGDGESDEIQVVRKKTKKATSTKKTTAKKKEKATIAEGGAESAAAAATEEPKGLKKKSLTGKKVSKKPAASPTGSTVPSLESQGSTLRYSVSLLTRSPSVPNASHTESLVQEEQRQPTFNALPGMVPDPASVREGAEVERNASGSTIRSVARPASADDVAEILPNIMDSSFISSSAASAGTVIVNSSPRVSPVQQVQNTRFKLNALLDDYRAYLQTILLMLQFDLDQLDSPAARDRLAGYIQKPYYPLDPKRPYDHTKDLFEKPLQSFNRIWITFTGAETNAKFKGKVKEGEEIPHPDYPNDPNRKAVDKNGLFYYLGKLITAGNEAGLGRRAKAMRAKRLELLELAKTNLTAKYEKLSDELKLGHEGHAFETIHVVQTFTNELMTTVCDGKIDLFGHSNRRIDQIKGIMDVAISGLRSLGEVPDEEELTTKSNELNEKLKAEMVSVEKQIERTWGSGNSHLRMAIHEATKPNGTFDKRKQRITAVRNLIQPGGALPDGLFAGDFCLLNQALLDALSSDQMMYNDARVADHLARLEGDLPDVKAAKVDIQEAMAKQIIRLLAPFEKDGVSLFSHPHDQLIPFLRGESRVGDVVYPMMLDPNPPATDPKTPFQAEACKQIRSLFSKYLQESVNIVDLEQAKDALDNVAAAFGQDWITIKLTENNTHNTFSDAELDAYIKLCLKAKAFSDLRDLANDGLVVGGEQIGALKIQEKIWLYLTPPVLENVEHGLVQGLIQSIVPDFLNKTPGNIKNNLYKVRLIAEYGLERQARDLDTQIMMALNSATDLPTFQRIFEHFLGLHKEHIVDVFSRMTTPPVQKGSQWSLLCDELIHQNVKDLSQPKQHELVQQIAGCFLSEAGKAKVRAQLDAIDATKRLIARLNEDQHWVQYRSEEERNHFPSADSLSDWKKQVDDISLYARENDKRLLQEAFISRRQVLLDFPAVKNAIENNILEQLVSVGTVISPDSLALFSVLENKYQAKSIFSGFDAFTSQLSQKSPVYFYFQLSDLLAVANSSQNDKDRILAYIKSVDVASYHPLHPVFTIVKQVAEYGQITFLSSVTEDMVSELNKANRLLLTLEQECSTTLLEAVTAFQSLFNHEIHVNNLLAVENPLEQDIEDRIKAEKELHEARRKLDTCFKSEFNESAKALLRQIYTEFKGALEPFDEERVRTLQTKLPFDRTVKLQNITTFIDLITAHPDSPKIISTLEGVSEDQLFNEKDILSVLTLSKGGEPDLLPDTINNAVAYLKDYYVPGSYILMGSDQEGDANNLSEKDDRNRLARRLWLCDRIVRHYDNQISFEDRAVIEKNREMTELHFLRHAIYHVQTDPPCRVDNYLVLLRAAYPGTEGHPGKYDDFFNFRLEHRNKPQCRPSYEALAAGYYCELLASLNQPPITVDKFLGSFGEQVRAAFVEQDFLTAARLIKTFYLVRSQLHDPSTWNAECPRFERSLLEDLDQLVFSHDEKMQALLDSKLVDIIAQHAKEGGSLHKKAVSLSAQCKSSLAFSKAITKELRRVESEGQLPPAVFLPEGPIFIATRVKTEWEQKLASLKAGLHGLAYEKLEKAFNSIVENVSDVGELRVAVERFNEESSLAVLEERIDLLDCKPVIHITDGLDPLSQGLTSWSSKNAEDVIKKYRQQNNFGHTRKWQYRYAEGLKPSEGSELITFEAYRVLIQYAKEYLRKKGVERSIDIKEALQVCARDDMMTFEDVNKGCLDQAVSCLTNPEEAWIGKQLLVVHEKITLIWQKINDKLMEFDSEQDREQKKQAYLKEVFIAHLVQLRQFISFHYSIFKQAQVQHGFKGTEAALYEKMLKDWSARLAAMTYPFAEELWSTFDGVMSVYPQPTETREQLVRKGSATKTSAASSSGSETPTVVITELTFIHNANASMSSLKEDSLEVGLQMAKTWQTTVFLSEYPEVKLACEQGFHNVWLEIHMISKQARDVFEGRSVDMASPIRRVALLRLLGLCLGWKGELPGQYNLQMLVDLIAYAHENPNTIIGQDILVLHKELKSYKQATSPEELSPQAKWLYASLNLMQLTVKESFVRDDCDLFVECCNYIDASMHVPSIDKILESVVDVGKKLPHILWRHWPQWCATRNPIVSTIQKLLFPLKSVEDLTAAYSLVKNDDIPQEMREWMQQQILSVTKQMWHQFILQDGGSLLPGLLTMADKRQLGLSEWAIKCFNSIDQVTGEARELLWKHLPSWMIKEDDRIFNKMQKLLFPLKSVEELSQVYLLIESADTPQAIKGWMQKQLLAVKRQSKDCWDQFMFKPNTPSSLLTKACSKEVELYEQREWAMTCLLSANDTRADNWLALTQKIGDEGNALLQLLKCKILIANKSDIRFAIGLFEGICSNRGLIELGAVLSAEVRYMIAPTISEIMQQLKSLITQPEQFKRIERLSQEVCFALCEIVPVSGRQTTDQKPQVLYSLNGGTSASGGRVDSQPPVYTTTH